MIALLWVLVAIAAAGVFLVINPQLLHKKTVKHATPFGTKRLARHPDGEVSSIEHFYVNGNGKRFWKFAEYSEEIQAEVPEDVLVEDGAWDGKGFFIFNRTRNGTPMRWNNPVYQHYFDWMAEKRAKAEVEASVKSVDEHKDRRLNKTPEKTKSELRDSKFVEKEWKKYEWDALRRFAGENYPRKGGFRKPADADKQPEKGNSEN